MKFKQQRKIMQLIDEHNLFYNHTEKENIVLTNYTSSLKRFLKMKLEELEI